jgi:hypothetical protein
MNAPADCLICEDDLICEIANVQNLGCGSALADLFCLPPQVLARNASDALKRDVSYIRSTSCGEGLYRVGGAIAERATTPQQAPKKHTPLLLSWLLPLFHAHASQATT